MPRDFSVHHARVHGVGAHTKSCGQQQALYIKYWGTLNASGCLHFGGTVLQLSDISYIFLVFSYYNMLFSFILEHVSNLSIFCLLIWEFGFYVH